MSDRLLSITEVALALDMSRQGVRKLIAAGKLPATKAGRQYVITEADLQAYRLEKAAEYRARLAQIQPRKEEP